ncbi:hypothetical protein BH23GEM6_BH23GEM6_05740 [soil metagenome]
MTLNRWSISEALSLTLGLMFLFVTSSPAQSISGGASLRGLVMVEGLGVAGATVELHRVTPSTSGVVNQTTSRPGGIFEFRLPPVDTVGFTVFFATAEYQGVRYFGRPLHPGDDAEEYRVIAYDTTSTPQTPVRISRRDMVLLPQQDGSWEVNEILRLLNPGTHTVVSASGMPIIQIDLPTDAVAFEAGDGDAPAEQVQRMGDRVLLLSPVIPGERELFFRYRLASRPASTQLTISAVADSFNMFVRQPAPHLTVEGLSPSEIIQVEGERFLQYSTSSDVQLRNLSLQWRGSNASPVSPVAAAIAISLVLLTVGGVAAYRNRPS